MYTCISQNSRQFPPSTELNRRRPEFRSALILRLPCWRHTGKVKAVPALLELLILYNHCLKIGTF